MRPPIRLGILECDTPIRSIIEKYGTFGRQFQTLLDAAAHAMKQPELSPISSNGSLDVSLWDVVDKMEYPDLDKVDALLVTGSSTSKRAFLIVSYIVPLHGKISSSRTISFRIRHVCLQTSLIAP